MQDDGHFTHMYPLASLYYLVSSDWQISFMGLHNFLSESRLKSAVQLVHSIFELYLHVEQPFGQVTHVGTYNPVSKFLTSIKYSFYWQLLDIQRPSVSK